MGGGQRGKNQWGTVFPAFCCSVWPPSLILDSGPAPVGLAATSSATMSELEPALHAQHAFFGLPGSHNDINMLHCSPIFLFGKWQYTTGGLYCQWKPLYPWYYLGDGIYPDWTTIVKSVRGPMSNKHTVYPKQHESCRKDVERCFGVLQAKWKILY
jgi:hypothetical protein